MTNTGKYPGASQKNIALPFKLGIPDCLAVIFSMYFGFSKTSSYFPFLSSSSVISFTPKTGMLIYTYREKHALILIDCFLSSEYIKRLRILNSYLGFLKSVRTFQELSRFWKFWGPFLRLAPGSKQCLLDKGELQPGQPLSSPDQQDRFLLYTPTTL